MGEGERDGDRPGEGEGEKKEGSEGFVRSNRVILPGGIQ